MTNQIIVSYDGSQTDDDALALGKKLSQAGSSLALAYVRHCRDFDARREELAQHDAEHRLEQGAAWIGAEQAPRHIVVNRSTPEGLRQLASEVGAQMVVFGSEYRTPPGQAVPGRTASGLLEGGPVAVAVAASGLRANLNGPIESIAVFGHEPEPAVARTAETLAGKLGAKLVDPGQPADLLVVGSQTGAPAGRVQLSGAARSELGSARSSILVLPSGFELGL